MGEAEKVEAFIARWQGQSGGQGRANYALFLTEFRAALDLPQPEPLAAPEQALSSLAQVAGIRLHCCRGDRV